MYGDGSEMVKIKRFYHRLKNRFKDDMKFKDCYRVTE